MSIQTPAPSETLTSENGISPATPVRYAHPRPDAATLSTRMKEKRRETLADSAFENKRILSELIAALRLCEDITEDEYRAWATLARSALRMIEADLCALLDTDCPF